MKRKRWGILVLAWLAVCWYQPGPMRAGSMIEIAASPHADAATNTTAYYAALLQSVPGDVLRWPAGTFVVNNLIADSKPHRTILGAGRGQTLLVGATGNDALLSVVRSEGLAVRGLGLQTQGVAAVYAMSNPGLLLDDVQTWGGRMAGIYLDRTPAHLIRVTVQAVRMNGAIGGNGVWVFRGGTGLRVDGLTVIDTDADGLKIDAGTTGDALATPCLGAALTGLSFHQTGQVVANAAALTLEGASNVTAQGVLIDGAGHGIVMHQDQSGAVPAGNVGTGVVFRNLTGYAVATLGAQGNAVLASWRDGSGVGAHLSGPGLGGAGAASTANTVEIAE